MGFGLILEMGVGGSSWNLMQGYKRKGNDAHGNWRTKWEQEDCVASVETLIFF